MTPSFAGAEGLVAACIGGLLTSASPCVLAAIPVAIGFVGGQDARGRRAWLMSLAFVTGMNLALVVLGLAAARLGLLLGALPGPWMVSVGLLLLGAAAAIGRGHGAKPCPSFPAAWQGRLQHSGLAGALAVGALMGTVMSPCATPALAAALAIAGTGTLMDGSIWWGATLLLAYGIGHSLLLLAAGAAPSTVHVLVHRLGSVQRWMPGTRAFSVLLAGAGLWWALQGLGADT